MQLTVLNRVDFPASFGLMRPQISPARTVSDIVSRATVPPKCIYTSVMVRSDNRATRTEVHGSESGELGQFDATTGELVPVKVYTFEGELTGS